VSTGAADNVAVINAFPRLHMKDGKAFAGDTTAPYFCMLTMRNRASATGAW
jgi:hypothetical protein